LCLEIFSQYDIIVAVLCMGHSDVQQGVRVRKHQPRDMVLLCMAAYGDRLMGMEDDELEAEFALMCPELCRSDDGETGDADAEDDEPEVSDDPAPAPEEPAVENDNSDEPPAEDEPEVNDDPEPESDPAVEGDSNADADDVDADSESDEKPSE